jgi:enterochelin esterase-like enzyme
VPNGPIPFVVSQTSPPDEKIDLFHSLFRGRDDTYPQRFESCRTEKAGYRPACGGTAASPRSSKPVRRTPAIVAAACVLAAVWFWLLNPSRPDRWAVASDALNETRHVLVRLPDGYATTSRTYPLVVLLDGGDRRQHSAEVPLYSRSVAALGTLERDGLAPMILVGIENRNRVHDMTPVERPDIYVGGGGALAFLRFIETELVPFVEARWRVGPTRILYGESYGGLFVLDALARGRRVFSDYIAVSPTVGVWPEGLAAALHQRMSADTSRATPAPDTQSTSSVFIIYGEKDAPLVTDQMPSIARLIESKRPAVLRFGVEMLPGAGHNPPGSLERGLRFVLDARR